MVAKDSYKIYLIFMKYLDLKLFPMLYFNYFKYKANNYSFNQDWSIYETVLNIKAVSILKT